MSSPKWLDGLTVLLVVVEWASGSLLMPFCFDQDSQTNVQDDTRMLKCHPSFHSLQKQRIGDRASSLSNILGLSSLILILVRYWVTLHADAEIIPSLAVMTFQQDYELPKMEKMQKVQCKYQQCRILIIYKNKRIPKLVLVLFLSSFFSSVF